MTDAERDLIEAARAYKRASVACDVAFSPLDGLWLAMKNVMRAVQLETATVEEEKAAITAYQTARSGYEDLTDVLELTSERLLASALKVDHQDELKRD